MTSIDEFLINVEKTIREFDETRNGVEKQHHQNIELFDFILKLKEASGELKASAVLGKQMAHTDMVHRSGEILILHTLKILAIHVKILEISIDDIRKKSGLSGIAEQSKDIERIRELENEVNTLKQEWQPYIDKMKQAFEFTEKYFEDNR